MKKIYLSEDVYDAALNRMRWLFDEFKNVVISSSGGKDSTIIMHLALKVAEEKNRLPIKMVFLDQEAEWQSTIDYLRKAMADPRIEPVWIQCPFKLFNTTSIKEPWLMCWKEGDKWMREKEPYAIKDNVFGTDRFRDVFTHVLDYLHPDEPACFLAGVRAEESPRRAIAMTADLTYKHITYGKQLNKKKDHYTFYPIYDWSLSDVWKAISCHKWTYNTLYDKLYRFGIAPKDMRVSNLHHETAVHNLFFLHEIEPETWDKLTNRLAGIHTTKHIKKEEMMNVASLPYMFRDWPEYRDYLTDKLISIEHNRLKFHRKWHRMSMLYDEIAKPEEMYKKQIKAILQNDWEYEQLKNWEESPPVIAYRKWKKGTLWIDDPKDPNLKLIKDKYK